MIRPPETAVPRLQKPRLLDRVSMDLERSVSAEDESVMNPVRVIVKGLDGAWHSQRKVATIYLGLDRPIQHRGVGVNKTAAGGFDFWSRFCGNNLPTNDICTTFCIKTSLQF